MSGMNTAEFDAVNIARPELAASYLGLLASQPGRPLALFAPRRIGKTFFLDQDLAPAARRRGWLPVYADLWLQRGAPLAAINHALEEALDDASVPAGKLGKAARTRVSKLSAFGASLDLGDAPARRQLPDAPELRFDTLVQRLHAAAGKPLLLMLDEAQALADGPNSEALAGSLRAVLHKRRAQVYAVLTGSSPDALAALLASTGAPMYHFAQVLNFPPLGDEFLLALQAQYARVHKGRKPPLDGCTRSSSASATSRRCCATWSSACRPRACWTPSRASPATWPTNSMWRAGVRSSTPCSRSSAASPRWWRWACRRWARRRASCSAASRAWAARPRWARCARRWSACASSVC
jgi:hypothetical protein